MKAIALFLAITFPLCGPTSEKVNLYQQKIKSAQGEEINLNNYKGKPLLLVNIATRCGYTGQLDGLEALYKKYQTKGLTIVGIPSNDFNGQTPEADAEVVKFCRLKYGVSFPITTKVNVKGKTKHELIDYLIKNSGGDEIGWNFEKFLFSKDGKFIARFPSGTTPEDKTLNKAIEAAL